jgi:tagatose-1,6-bisphosphate aldolase
VSVDTNVKHKNLAPYRRVRIDDLRILVAKELPGMASAITVDTGGLLGRKLTIELSE